jgi:hypothetical protein
MSVELSPAQIEALKNDIAYDIHEAPTIAKRYGFDSVIELKQYLVSNPWIAGDAGHMRSVFNSDDSTPKRVTLKSLVAYEDIGIVAMSQIIADPNKSASDRIAAAKLLKDSAGIGYQKDQLAQTGTIFNLTISLPGRTKDLTTVVQPPSDLPLIEGDL